MLDVNLELFFYLFRFGKSFSNRTFASRYDCSIIGMKTHQYSIFLEEISNCGLFMKLYLAARSSSMRKFNQKKNYANK